MKIHKEQEEKAPETIEELEEVYYFANGGELFVVKWVLIIEPTCGDVVKIHHLLYQVHYQKDGV